MVKDLTMRVVIWDREDDPREPYWLIRNIMEFTPERRKDGRATSNTQFVIDRIFEAVDEGAKVEIYKNP